MNPDEQKKLDDMSFGREQNSEINREKQGISNRPGDEDPDSGVDREPGPDLTESDEEV